ncbi:glycogen debranching protein GlgX [Subtercola boreus]|uniref:Glycogen debranching enzyme GlgX n=1 Tax=Subtercola boreus TaxID=120213 RepID=A0A3E0WBV6_9MICO|nr:glycogen debranching protein GlgX [Subtercola boreus]RFA22048.1 glycogen debranching enzyme GlgX [Subtercola boreus]RFA22228.1 glycogen debranching enzyme GlgX [Subtercola boreus]RFA28091.1 glycogen debranching enzyme GlgX [Subtercola boreus]
MTQADPFAHLGIRQTAAGGELRVWSENATSIELCLFDQKDPNWIFKTVTMTRDGSSVWLARTRSLAPGRRYALRVAGPNGPEHPQNSFDPTTLMLDPYARGLTRTGPDLWRGVVVDTDFDWNGATKPNTPLDHTVIYEGHVKGLSRLNTRMPEHLRGTYAGLAHETTIGYLQKLGVTAVQLLPVHAFVSERRLMKQGLTNYWGYNTLNFFTPHPLYGTKAAQQNGPSAILREFKGMVKLLHEAGLEVILDVVYNHTAEEGITGPRSSFRGIDNANYYRQTKAGHYIDVTGCGNSVDTSVPAVSRLVLDSLKYWANEVQIDGFRFDLAATLGRNHDAYFDPDHPLLHAITNDPDLTGVKMIAEPWDVGMGGWQTGNFAPGWHEWNDRYRDRMRKFWLRDTKSIREHGSPGDGVGMLATRLAGSANTFSQQRGPLASINFVTAHDGFTLADLTAYDVKHNVGNGESNRDGTDNNMSYNHGVEGATPNRSIEAARRRTIRNLMGTLLLSAGIPMITAGDEFGRSQKGNNNAYCHDSELTWLSWDRRKWQNGLWQTTQHLLKLRRENSALRPSHFGVFGETTPSASQMDWYDADGGEMSNVDWNSPENRTLQFLAASTPEHEEFNRVLVVIHGVEQATTITLPRHEGVECYELLWDSAEDAPTAPDAQLPALEPGVRVPVSGSSMQLYRAH